MNFEFLNSPISLGYYYLLAIYYIFIFSLAIKILLEQKDPAKTIGYILLLIFVPIFGLLVYQLFGINLRKQKLFNRKALTDQKNMRAFLDQNNQLFYKDEKELENLVGSGAKLAKLLINSDNANLTKYNKIELIENGENVFPKMLQEIEKAEHFIHMEFYKIANDITGNKFFDAIKKKAKQGVEVRLIYDDVGSIDINNRLRSELEQNNIMAYPFMPVRFPRFTSRINYRDHRKILIIDGKMAFMGGINLRDAYDNSIKKPLFWKDLSFKLEGEALYRVQLLFFLNWYFVSNQMLEFSNKYFKPNSLKALCPTQIIASGPDNDWPSIMQAILESINAAKKSVKICTPYFVPNASIVSAIINTALSGVDVQILLPTNPDSRVAKAVSISYLGELLDAGVKIYMYTKGMMHAKYLCVDEAFCTIGSANIDIRSFEYNFEINTVIYDTKTTKSLVNIFESDKQNSYLLTKEQWNNRPFRKKLAQGFMRIVAPLL